MVRSYATKWIYLDNKTVSPNVRRIIILSNLIIFNFHAVIDLIVFIHARA
jgi:hypothetical protein